jgi:hypothetical protein
MPGPARASSPELRIMSLELQHAERAIERARLLSKGSEFEADLARLLEAARATLDLIKVPAMNLPKEDVF